jgi:hypothetical protein
MRNDHPSVHNTEINRIQNGDEGGWEFVCHSCGYRARYTMDRHGTQRLEILFVGDTSARHTSGQTQMPIDGLKNEVETSSPLDDAGLDASEVGLNELWLPKNVQEQVEAILRKFD